MILDIFVNYLYFLKWIAVFIAVSMLISGVDDLFIDIYYWVRRFIRSVTIYKKHPRMSYKKLYELDEKPLAIMVPAWNERGVIGPMAELAASTLDYENYHIFVGTYPNDLDTQKEVDEVCARFPNVHKIICARPGPTSKADCLNNVFDAIIQFERSTKLEFSGFILHDAEDVISPLELRLFNYLVDKKDLIQVPVYPFERKWTDFTSNSYMDEFAELHSKDVPVREALSGQVPSAGVGTCFSRQAINTLLIEGDGIAFDTQSLTEDYDIGFRLKKKGLNEVFVRFPVITDEDHNTKLKLFQRLRTANVICVREYFPDTFSTAVRQKSRWIIGIIFQGYKTHRWTSNIIINYFLWRDRKGIITNFLSFIAMIIFLQLVLLALYQWLWPDPWSFLSIFSDSQWLVLLLWLNFFLMLNRIAQRVIFVSGYYGFLHGILSVLRLFWGNIINFFANWRALMQVLQQGDPRRVAWDKTTHDFPMVNTNNINLKPLGEILIDQGYLTQDQLEEGLKQRVLGLRLGGSLIYQQLINAEQLAHALAIQADVDYHMIDPYMLDKELIQGFSDQLALHYAVLPIRIYENTLYLASESRIDPVSIAALSRKTGYKIKYFIVSRGQAVLGLRYWYARHKMQNDEELLIKAFKKSWITKEQKNDIWRTYESSQVLMAEILTSLGYLSPSVLAAVLLRHANTILPLGEFFVKEGIVTQDVVDQALGLQQKLQYTITELLTLEGLTQSQLNELKGDY